MFITLQGKDLDGKDKTLKVNTTQIAFIVDDYIHMGNTAVFQLDDENMKILDDALCDTPKQVRENKLDNGLIELFGKLHTLTGGKGKPIFNEKRQRQLRLLLDPKKGGMTPELLIKAATNIGKDAFLQGDNDSKKRYGDVDYLLRPDKAAKYAEIEIKEKKGMF